MPTKAELGVSGVHGINQFLWAKLQSDLGWDKKNYRGLIPIITPQEEQQFNDSGFPYITYTYRNSSTDTNFYIREESIVYVIHSADEQHIRETMGVIDYYFTHFDDSATVVNRFIQSEARAVFKEFDYKTISAPAVSGPSPTGQEGGIQDATASLYVTYVRERMLRVE